MRVAIIGLGGVGKLHLAAASACPDAELAALVDPFSPELEDLAKGVGTASYRDPAVMLEREKPELVIIATPAATHAELTLLAASQGAHILCEKPLAVTLADGQAMVRACADAGVQLLYGASYRFIPALLAAKRLIDSGAIGAVRLIRETIICGKGQGSHSPMGPAHYPAGGPGGSGLGLVDHGVHLIDLFSWLAGAEIERVYGQGNISGATPDTEFMVAHLSDGGLGLLVYADETFPGELPGEGVFGLGGGWDSDGSLIPAGGWQKQPLTIFIHGHKGTLRVFPYAHLLYVTDGAGTRQIAIEGAPPPAQFEAQLDAAIRAAKGLPSPSPNGEIGVRALASLLAVYRSASAGTAARPADLLEHHSR